MRELTDPRVLRGMAHPFRLALLELVERRGTLTSAEASAATGESTASCSFHLRQLAKYGFLEPAEAPNGRERPWRRATAGERIPDADDPQLARAAADVFAMLFERLQRDALRWMETQADLPRSWRRASVVDEELLYLTATELRELSRAVTDLFADYRVRTADTSLRPRASRPVRAAALLFPLPDER